MKGVEVEVCMLVALGCVVNQMYLGIFAIFLGH